MADAIEALPPSEQPGELRGRLEHLLRSIRREDGTWKDVPRFIRYALLAGLVPGLVLDVIFNVTWGSWDYREWFPKEWTFSERTQRVSRNPRHRRHRRGLWWKHVLNLIEPGHID